MSNRPFRFVHASDFHLERPLFGVSEVPDHWREQFLEAPYRAATKVFDAVLDQRAEFLVLSGDLLHPETAGPRGTAFLLEQFERLAAHDIHVYWAAGQVDAADAWPGVKLPANVRLFSAVRPEEFVETRDGVAIAHLAGLSYARRRKIRPADFWPDKAGLFSIAVTYGEADAPAFAPRGIHYWALGSAHARSTLVAAPCVAHYPGSPQGRQPSETGAHGCTLVAVDANSAPTSTFVPTDLVRWQSQRLLIDETTTREQFEQAIDARLQETIAANAGVDVLISWTVVGSGPLATALRRGKAADEVLARLRHDYGHRLPSAWSVSLAVEPPARLAERLYEQDTIQSEFLRAVRDHQAAEPTRDADELNLTAYLSERHLAGTLASVLGLDDIQTRERVLRQAALLGADLLSGEENHA